MASPMFERAAPKDLADRAQVIETKEIISAFPRLVEVVEADLGCLEEPQRPQDWRQAAVDIRLAFGWTDACPGVPSVRGRVTATVAAVCQRCLEAFDMVLETQLDLLLPNEGTALEYTGEFEVWEFDENTVTPLDIVEEALILAMPFSALHVSSDECNSRGKDSVVKDDDLVRPFADLKSMLAGAQEND